MTSNNLGHHVLDRSGIGDVAGIGGDPRAELGGSSVQVNLVHIVDRCSPSVGEKPLGNCSADSAACTSHKDHRLVAGNAQVVSLTIQIPSL